MPSARHSFQAAGVLGALMLCASCSSPNVNPPAAKAHKGYVDFYAPGQTNLAWELRCAASESDAFRLLFSSVKPLPSGVLRLELNPGSHLFELDFLNRVTEPLPPFRVDIREGCVTPVKVEVVPLGSIIVAQKQESVGPNLSGAGRKSRYSTQVGARERVVVTEQPATLYVPRQLMIYPP